MPFQIKTIQVENMIHPCLIIYRGKTVVATEDDITDDFIQIAKSDITTILLYGKRKQTTRPLSFVQQTQSLPKDTRLLQPLIFPPKFHLEL